jgi:hypothetical protein
MLFRRNRSGARGEGTDPPPESLRPAAEGNGAPSAEAFNAAFEAVATLNAKLNEIRSDHEQHLREVRARLLRLEHRLGQVEQPGSEAVPPEGEPQRPTRTAARGAAKQGRGKDRRSAKRLARRRQAGENADDG